MDTATDTVEARLARVPAQIRAAREYRAAAGGSEYVAVRVDAATRTMLWAVEGGTSPVGKVAAGGPVAAAELVAEQRAADDEERAQRSATGRGTFPGVVSETLEWVLRGGRDPF